MGRWSYYSPAMLGVVLAVITFFTYQELLPSWPAWQSGMVLVAASVGGGLVCQLAMVAAQGAFAQVLPVPGGRSIRGAGAAASGWLLLLALVVGLAAALLVVEHVRVATVIVAGLAGALASAAVVIYIWNWPTAIRDFRDER